MLYKRDLSGMHTRYLFLLLIFLRKRELLYALDSRCQPGLREQKMREGSWQIYRHDWKNLELTSKKTWLVKEVGLLHQP